MSSSENRIRILLDTTYLLPIVGVEVEGVEEALRTLEKLYRLGRAKIYYTQFNILEIMGKLSRIDYDRRRVMLGLKSIREAFRVTHPTPAGYLKALELRRKGFKRPHRPPPLHDVEDAEAKLPNEKHEAHRLPRSSGRRHIQHNPRGGVRQETRLAPGGHRYTPQPAQHHNNHVEHSQAARTPGTR